MAVSSVESWQAELDRLSEQDFAYYLEHLKEVLEPAHNGETVAIHLESGDHAVAANAPRALRALVCNGTLQRARAAVNRRTTNNTGPVRNLDRALGHPTLD